MSHCWCYHQQSKCRLLLLAGVNTQQGHITEYYKTLNIFEYKKGSTYKLPVPIRSKPFVMKCIFLPGLFCIMLLVSFRTSTIQDVIYRTSDGQISFVSEAPLELIKAASSRMKGAIDPATQTFAFSVQNESFEGFNSALQREHFNENYMESTRFPTCSFSGKIIESVDFKTDGVYTVRAKGKLKAHGVEQERIIRSTLAISNGIVTVSSQFVVPLEEHNITIPKIVHQKIAEHINVEIKAVLTPQPK